MDICIAILDQCRKSFQNFKIVDIDSSTVAVGFWPSAICQRHWLPWTCYWVRRSLELLLHAGHCQSQFTLLHLKLLMLEDMMATVMCASYVWTRWKHSPHRDGFNLLLPERLLCFK